MFTGNDRVAAIGACHLPRLFFAGERILSHLLVAVGEMKGTGRFCIGIRICNDPVIVQHARAGVLQCVILPFQTSIICMVDGHSLSDFCIQTVVRGGTGLQQEIVFFGVTQPGSKHLVCDFPFDVAGLSAKSDDAVTGCTRFASTSQRGFNEFGCTVQTKYLAVASDHPVVPEAVSCICLPHNVAGMAIKHNKSQAGGSVQTLRAIARSIASELTV